MKRVKSILFFSACTAAAIISVSLLFVILTAIIVLGAPAIHFGFLTQETKDFGHQGGILYQMLGTIILITGAGVVSLPIAVGCAIFQTEYLRPSLKRAVAVMIYALNGVPTILFGLFGYLILGVYLDWGVSWLTGSVILALMILPTLIVSLKEAIESMPGRYREAAFALGLTGWQTIHAVIIPQTLFGIVTGLLLGLARAAGETAAIMFTATTFSGINLPHSLYEPVTSLQTHLFILSQEAIDQGSRTNAWGTALVLVGLILFLNIGSLLIRRKLSWEAER